MMTYTKVSAWFFLILACASLITFSFVYMSKGEVPTKYEKSIAVMVTAKAIALKEVYNLTEPIPLVVAIANHSQKPVYIHMDQPGILTPFIELEDANGVRIMGDPVPTPPPPPRYYYINGMFTVPVVKIEGMDVMLAVIPDALERYHKYLEEGTYYLTPGDVSVIHEVSSVIIREDVPHPLWIDPSSDMIRLGHKLNTIKVEVRGEGAQEIN